MRVRRWLIRLYPRSWRERYADEFEALLEACLHSPLDALDISLGALDAHLGFPFEMNWRRMNMVNKLRSAILLVFAGYIGFILGGIPGAILATIGIFLPSFIFVAISNPFIPRMRNSVWVSGLLDGVNVASLSLMAAVTWQLGRASLTDPVTVLIALVSLLLLIRFKINSTWLIAGGALTGLLRALI